VKTVIDGVVVKIKVMVPNDGTKEFSVLPNCTYRYLKLLLMDQLKKECYNSIDKFKLTYTGNVLPHENTFVEYPISFKPQFESNINMQHLLHLSPRNPDALTVRCMVGRIPFFVDIDAYASFQDLTKMIENLICNREKPLFIYFFPRELLVLEGEENCGALTVEKFILQQEGNTVQIKNKTEFDGMFRIHVLTPKNGTKIFVVHPKFTLLYFKIILGKQLGMCWNEVKLTYGITIFDDSKHHQTLEELELEEDCNVTVSFFLDGGASTGIE